MAGLTRPGPARAGRGGCCGGAGARRTLRLGPSRRRLVDGGTLSVDDQHRRGTGPCRFQRGRGVALALKNLAHVALWRGDPAQASARLAEAIERYRRVGSKEGVAVCLEAFARVAVARRPARAARLLGAAAALREAIGAPLALADRADRDASATAATRALGGAAFAAAWAEGRAMSLEQAADDALADAPSEV